MNVEWRRPAQGKRPASTWQWWAQHVPVATVARWFGDDGLTALLAGTVIDRPLADAPAEWRLEEPASSTPALDLEHDQCTPAGA